MLIFCYSYCPEHKWRTRAETFKPDKRSIFNPTETAQQDNKQNQDADENASDTDSEENPVLRHLQRAGITKEPGKAGVLTSKSENVKEETDVRAQEKMDVQMKENVDAASFAQGVGSWGV